MQRYRAIFKYAIFINLAVALYMVALTVPAISHYYTNLAQWTEFTTSGSPQFGFDGPVQPRPSQLIFAWVLLSDAVILVAATLYSVWRRTAWVDWTRIFAVLAIWFAFWLEGLMLLAFLFDLGFSWTWHLTWVAAKALALPLFACLWLVYNIVYRTRRAALDAALTPA